MITGVPAHKASLVVVPPLNGNVSKAMWQEDKTSRYSVEGSRGKKRILFEDMPREANSAKTFLAVSVESTLSKSKTESSFAMIF